MRFAHWITKATNTHSEYVIINAFPGQNGYVNEPECYVYMYNACLVCFWKLQTANPESVAPSNHFHVNDRPNSVPWSYSLVCEN